MLFMQDHLRKGEELKEIEAKRKAMIEDGLMPWDEEDEYTQVVGGEDNIDDEDLTRACKESERMFEFEEMHRNSVSGPPTGMGSQTQYHPGGSSHPNLG